METDLARPLLPRAKNRFLQLVTAAPTSRYTGEELNLNAMCTALPLAISAPTLWGPSAGLAAAGQHSARERAAGGFGWGGGGWDQAGPSEMAGCHLDKQMALGARGSDGAAP